MGADLLTGLEAEELRDQALTYAEVGGTWSDPPPGFHAMRRSRVVGTGADRFEAAARTLLGWDMHRRAGVRVRPSRETVATDAVAVLRLGGGRLGLDAPVRVVYVIDEATRRGFAYGTLPGHPESGEEAFVVELLDTGEVEFTITAFSRPASVLARWGGPVGGAVQRWVAHRYLRAL